MLWPTATEYVEAIQHPRTCFMDQDLQDGTPALDRLGMPFVSSGQFAYVFKLKHATGKASAIRCFRGFMGDRERRYKAIDQQLDSVAVPAVASFEYEADGILVGPNRYPTLVMEWLDGPTLDVYLEAVLQDRSVVLHLADQWIRVVKSLRAAKVAHGDLQHGNIIVQNGMLRLVDLDGMFVPSMLHMISCELGHRHYQHPRRDEFFFNGDLDNFSALVIYLSLLSLAERPDLWRRFHDENLIFTRPDFLDPSNSLVFSEVGRIGGEHKRLLDVLEKACRSTPSMTPALSDLVTPTSKLPSWMLAPAGVMVATKTREVIPGRSLSGASSSPVWGAAPGAAQAQRPAPAQPYPTPYVASQGQVVPVDWQRVRVDAIAVAIVFGVSGLLFIWAWLPLLNGIYRDLGFGDDSVGLTILTYVFGSLAFGLFRGIQKARRSGKSGAFASRSSAPIQYPVPSPNPPQAGRPSSPYPLSRPLQSGSLVASRARLIYHRPTCEWARKISTRNKVSFASTADAQAAGYRRCGKCSP